MTILGEFVRPAGQAVWTSTLVRALGLVAVEEKSARQALARDAAERWLTSEREGRRVRWHVTPMGRRLLTEGAERIYSLGRPRTEWDRHWLVVITSVPESQRDNRHRLRKQMTWAGLGSPSAGVWVTPNSARQPEVKLILADLGLADDTLSFVATFGDIGRELNLVTQAWNLDDVAAEYERFIDAFTGLVAHSDEEAFVHQVRLVDSWRRFPFLDPQLPAELLPAQWSGTRAAALFAAKHDEWHGDAQRYWARLTAEA